MLKRKWIIYFALNLLILTSILEIMASNQGTGWTQLATEMVILAGLLDMKED